MLRERLPQQSGWVNFGRRLPRKVGQFCTPINTYLLSCNIDSPNRERSIDWHADRHRTSTPTNSQSDRKGSNSPKPIRVNCWPTCCAARIALRDFRLATHRYHFPSPSSNQYPAQPFLFLALTTSSPSVGQNGKLMECALVYGPLTVFSPRNLFALRILLGTMWSAPSSTCTRGIKKNLSLGFTRTVSQYACRHKRYSFLLERMIEPKTRHGSALLRALPR